MIRIKFKSPIIFFIVAVLFGWGSAVVVHGFQNQPLQTQIIEVELRSVSQPKLPGPIFYPMRQLLVDSFERATLAPWTSTGQAPAAWGIRDTTDTYGPQLPAFSGYRYAGHPDTDQPEYPSSGANPGLMCQLTSPTIDLTGVDSLFISFNYWGDFEGAATNFDGGIVEISPDDGTTWFQIDSLAQGELNPTYDARLCNTGQLDTAWAYCYDTDPNWISVSSQDLIALGYVATGDQIKIRFTFASDALSGGQGWFIDDVRIAETPPPDLQPPIIDHTPLSDTPDTLNPYTISATVTDQGSGVDYDSVYLHYQIEAGPIVDVQMDTIGTGNPDIYEAEIPTQNWHTDIYYQISAADLVGNEAVTPVYNFEVTNALTISYDDGQPYWVPGDIEPGDGQFVTFSLDTIAYDSAIVHKVIYYFDGPGPFDLHIYEGYGPGIPPGPLLDSLLDLNSTGYEWQFVEVTNLDLHIIGHVVAGFMSKTNGVDTTRVLMDPIVQYGQRMWIWDGLTGGWAQSVSGGDFMIRLKVIPLGPGGAEETPGDLPGLPSAGLGQVLPNPMRNKAVIDFQLPTTQKVSLNVYDVAGQLIRKLVDGHEKAGTHQVYWNGKDEQGNSVASGVYFLKFAASPAGTESSGGKTAGYITTRKFLLIR